MTREATAPSQGKRRFQFVSDTIAELKKVVWPPRKDATYLTTVVIVVTLSVAIILGVVDYAFAKLMELILLS